VEQGLGFDQQTGPDPQWMQVGNLTQWQKQELGVLQSLVASIAATRASGVSTQGGEVIATVQSWTVVVPSSHLHLLQGAP